MAIALGNTMKFIEPPVLQKQSCTAQNAASRAKTAERRLLRRAPLFHCCSTANICGKFRQHRGDS